MNKTKTINEEIIAQLVDANNRNQHNLDLGDVGNEIGIVIAKHFNDNDIGFDKESFISGLKHGISLTDGTHG